MPVRLSGPERGELAAILINAFPPRQFEQLLLYRLNRRLVRLAAPGDYDSVMFEVLEKAVAQWWVGDLLVAAHEENPRDPFLISFAARFGAAVEIPNESALQHIIRSTNSFLDVAIWRSRLGELEGQVCRVEVEVPAGSVFGTGFLVGPRSILTNYHVVEDVIEGRVSPAAIAFRFDYKVVQEKANEGRVYRAAGANEWLIDSSKYSELDLAYTLEKSPSEEELDYAVIRLAERVGELPIGNGTPDAASRGWVSFTDPPKMPAKSGTMHILQHPNGAPMKLALGSEAILGVNANATRVRYSTNTLGGSSGSPGFDENWALLALHHAGDPRFPQFSKAEYNQGIPISAIARRLQRQAKLSALLA